MPAVFSAACGLPNDNLFSSHNSEHASHRFERGQQGEGGSTLGAGELWGGGKVFDVPFQITS